MNGTKSLTPQSLQNPLSFLDFLTRYSISHSLPSEPAVKYWSLVKILDWLLQTGFCIWALLSLASKFNIHFSVNKLLWQQSEWQCLLFLSYLPGPPWPSQYPVLSPWMQHSVPGLPPCLRHVSPTGFLKLRSRMPKADNFMPDSGGFTEIWWTFPASRLNRRANYLTWVP